MRQQQPSKKTVAHKHQRTYGTRHKQQLQATRTYLEWPGHNRPPPFLVRVTKSKCAHLQPWFTRTTFNSLDVWECAPGLRHTLLQGSGPTPRGVAAKWRPRGAVHTTLPAPARPCCPPAARCPLSMPAHRGRERAPARPHAGLLAQQLWALQERCVQGCPLRAAPPVPSRNGAQWSTSGTPAGPAVSSSTVQPPWRCPPCANCTEL